MDFNHGVGNVIRCETIFGMHKFEMVPIKSNAIEFLEEDISSSKSRLTSNDFSMDEFDMPRERSVEPRKQVMVTMIVQMDLKLRKLDMGPYKAMLKK